MQLTGWMDNWPHVFKVCLSAVCLVTVVNAIYSSSVLFFIFFAQLSQKSQPSLKCEMFRCGLYKA